MDGSVHQVNLFRQRVDKFGRAAMEAVGGGGVNDTIRIKDEDPQTAKKRLISVGCVPHPVPPAQPEPHKTDRT